MKPIGLLMKEHRIIEQMIKLIDNEIKRLDSGGKPDNHFIDIAIDFIRTYADRTHHGKEEDILFKDCANKSMTEQDNTIMNELVEEHKYARKTVVALIEAKEKFQNGDGTQKSVIIDKLKDLVDFYPVHIKREDDVFFPDTERYFSDDELNQMLDQFFQFDQNMIHEKYQSVVKQLESQKNKSD